MSKILSVLMGVGLIGGVGALTATAEVQRSAETTSCEMKPNSQPSNCQGRRSQSVIRDSETRTPQSEGMIRGRGFSYAVIAAD
jgi:hypothetical protein